MYIKVNDQAWIDSSAIVTATVSHVRDEHVVAFGVAGGETAIVQLPSDVNAHDHEAADRWLSQLMVSLNDNPVAADSGPGDNGDGYQAEIDRSYKRGLEQGYAEAEGNLKGARDELAEMERQLRTRGEELASERAAFEWRVSHKEGPDVEQADGPRVFSSIKNIDRAGVHATVDDITHRMPMSNYTLGVALLERYGYKVVS